LHLFRELNGFHFNVVSAVHLDRAITAIPVMVVIEVPIFLRMRHDLWEFVPIVLSMAWRRLRWPLISMLASYEYDSKDC